MALNGLSAPVWQILLCSLAEDRTGVTYWLLLMPELQKVTAMAISIGLLGLLLDVRNWIIGVRLDPKQYRQYAEVHTEWPSLHLYYRCMW